MLVVAVVMVVLVLGIGMCVSGFVFWCWGVGVLCFWVLVLLLLLLLLLVLFYDFPPSVSRGLPVYLSRSAAVFLCAKRPVKLRACLNMAPAVASPTPTYGREKWWSREFLVFWSLCSST